MEKNYLIGYIKIANINKISAINFKGKFIKQAIILSNLIKKTFYKAFD